MDFKQILLNIREESNQLLLLLQTKHIYELNQKLASYGLFVGDNFSKHEYLQLIQQFSALDLALGMHFVSQIAMLKLIKPLVVNPYHQNIYQALIDGTATCGIAITESGGGSNTRANTAYAIREEDSHWRLYGEKAWVSITSANAYLIILLKTEQKYTLFLISAQLVKRYPINGLGLKEIEQYSVSFDNLVIADEQRLGEIGQGLEFVEDILMFTRQCIMAMGLGLIKRVLQLMVRFGSRRSIQNGILLNSPTCQITLNDMACKALVLEKLLQLSVEADDIEISDKFILMGKIWAAEWGFEAVDRLIQWMGSRGYNEANGIPKMWRDARAFRLMEGPTETLTLHLGLTGINSQKFLAWLEETVPTIDADDIAWKSYEFSQWILGCSYRKIEKLLGLSLLNQSKSPDLGVFSPVAWLTQAEVFAVINAFEKTIGNLSVFQSKDPLLAPLVSDHILYGKPLERFIDPSKSVIQLFNECVEIYFDQTAIVDSTHVMSYRELHTAVLETAAGLMLKGYGKGDIIAIKMPRSPQQIIGLIAILSIGAVCLPLDQSLPEERTHWMLLKAKARLCLDHDNFQDFRASEYKHIENVQPSQLAYIIFTSGSTGDPKAVMIEHQSLSNLVQAQAQIYAIDAQSRFLQYIRLAFDVSIGEIFMVLCHGGVLYLPPQDLLPGAELVDMIEMNSISHIELPASVLAVLPNRTLPDLKVVISGGEQASEKLVQAWGEGRIFYNAYGPTETCITATIAQLDPAQPTPNCIGRLLPNLKAFILDENLQIVPKGEVGEICIAGIGLAQGYLEEHNQTERAFITLPIGGESIRLYRTGDKGRITPQLDLEFLGRLDRQIKLRGYRIELEEIESQLRAIPFVKQAAVIVKRQTLFAYLVLETIIPEVETVLYQYLAKKLAPYMIPSQFHILDTLPTNRNGKIDYHYLSTLLLKHSEDTVLTDTEQVLKNIWADLLDFRDFNRDDNFFSLGGHSLLVGRVIARVEKQLSLRLSFNDVFNHPTIAELALLLDQMAGTNREEFLL